MFKVKKNIKVIGIFSITLILLISFASISYASYSSSYSEPTILIKQGSYGTGVKWVQDMLNHNGYSLTVDGAFGTKTYNAVVNFQKNKDLLVDGIVGSATRNALKNNAYSTNTINAYRYTNTRVNFRNGPGISYYSKGILEKGTKIYVYQVRNDGWAYIKYNNSYGYVYNQYLSTSINNTVTINLNGLPTFQRTNTNLLEIIKACKTYYTNNNFVYSLAPGVRTIPADKSKLYNGNYSVDCSSYVSWVLYEYALINGKTDMKNYFSYQRNSSTFANIGANGGNNYLEVIDSGSIDLSKAKQGDILVSPGHVEFFNSYTQSGNMVNIKVYNCGSTSTVRVAGVTTSATRNVNDISYILRVR